MPNPDSESNVKLVKKEIPNSYYLEFGEEKYLGFDSADNYEVALRGTGTGTFTFELDDVSGDTVTRTLVYKDIPVTPMTAGRIILDPSITAFTPTQEAALSFRSLHPETGLPQAEAAR